MNLAVAISTVCPSGEVEELTISMLNIFESRGRTFELMEALIKQEIEDTRQLAAALGLTFLSNNFCFQRMSQKYYVGIASQPRYFLSTQNGRGRVILKPHSKRLLRVQR